MSKYKILTYGNQSVAIATNSDIQSIVSYSLRLFNENYVGNAISVRRSIDDQVTDIGFVNGELDVDSLETFSAGGNVYVTTWYDQSGNGSDLIQASSSLQPLIVESGSVLRDRNNRPRLYFDSDSMVAITTGLSNQNLTAFFVVESEYSDAYKYLFLFGDENKEYNWLSSGMTNINYTIYYMGDGSSWNTGSGSTSSEGATTQPAWPTIQILDLRNSKVRYFRNRQLFATLEHTKNVGAHTRMKIGSYTGYLSEIAIYEALSDYNRISIYNKINNRFITGPIYINDTILPQTWKWQVDLYDWLKTITIEDVTISPIFGLRWDSTYNNDLEYLSNLQLGFGKGRSDFKDARDCVVSEPKWFVLDDGNGSGIEATGTVKLFRNISGAALWHNLDLKLAEGGQGNCYYHNHALALRGLISMAVDMIKHDWLWDNSPGYWAHVDFVGGTTNGWIWTYKQLKYVLSAEVQAAFEEGFKYIGWKIAKKGPHDVNGNIDMKAIAALAHIYTLVDDEVFKDIYIRGAKLILFGSETGTPEESDYVTGLYRPGGYIDEADSPETTYNGAALYYLMEAYSCVKGDSNWDFLETVVEKMTEFKAYQYFPDPDNKWDGPSGYAGRTGGSYVYDQRDKAWRYLASATNFEVGYPFFRNIKNGGYYIPPSSTLISDVYAGIGWCSGALYSQSSGIPSNWSEDHWPSENLYYPSSGWYSEFRPLIETNDHSLYYPFEGTGIFNKSFANEFWAYKNHNGERNFGFFVETLEYAGSYKGWYGGSLQTFWASGIGIITLAKHDKSGSDISDQENTRVWSDIDRWGTHHTWGKDSNNKGFSTSCTDGITHNVNYSISGSNPYVSIETILGSGSTRGKDTGTILNGPISFTNEFQALSNGLKITTDIINSGSDTINELWTTVPIYLRNYERQSSISDSTIEYLNGSNWESLTTNLTTSSGVRIGRNFGSGAKYSYIQFDNNRSIKLSNSVWQQSYQDTTRLRNIHVDLHGSSGVPIVFPSSTSISYSIVV